jgi:hypothetical protein
MILRALCQWPVVYQFELLELLDNPKPLWVKLGFVYNP